MLHNTVVGTGGCVGWPLVSIIADLTRASAKILWLSKLTKYPIMSWAGLANETVLMSAIADIWVSVSL